VVWSVMSRLLSPRVFPGWVGGREVRRQGAEGAAQPGQVRDLSTLTDAMDLPGCGATALWQKHRPPT
jgi:hypothetical protein